MMVEEFHRIYNFYKEKTFFVSDDRTFTDIFNFFATRDLDLEAPILAEKEWEGVTERIQPIVDIIDKEMLPANADEIMEEVMLAPYEFRYSKAEMFYMDCQITNPKDVWNEFTFVENSNFDFSKIGSLLIQKSKNYYLLEKKKENAMCFGILFTEGIAFKNWLNRKQIIKSTSWLFRIE